MNFIVCLHVRDRHAQGSHSLRAVEAFGQRALTCSPAVIQDLVHSAAQFRFGLDEPWPRDALSPALGCRGRHRRLRRNKEKPATHRAAAGIQN